MAQTPQAAREFFNLTENIPVILVVGGSLGAQTINEAIASILPELVEQYYVIHQIGKGNMEAMLGTASIALGDNAYKGRYRPFDYLDNLNLEHVCRSCKPDRFTGRIEHI